jgi:hypothetical protein
MNSPTGLHWYVAVLVLESSIAEGPSGPLVDIQFRLIRAPDAESAYERALTLGRDAEHSYENPYGQTCAWTFRGLKDLEEVIEDELGDGVEVYGFIEDGAAEDYILPKEQLAVFHKGALMGGESDPDEWRRES